MSTRRKATDRCEWRQVIRPSWGMQVAWKSWPSAVNAAPRNASRSNRPRTRTWACLISVVARSGGLLAWGRGTRDRRVSSGARQCGDGGRDALPRRNRGYRRVISRYPGYLSVSSQDSSRDTPAAGLMRSPGSENHYFKCAPTCDFILVDERPSHSGLGAPFHCADPGTVPGRGARRPYRPLTLARERNCLSAPPGQPPSRRHRHGALHGDGTDQSADEPPYPDRLLTPEAAAERFGVTKRWLLDHTDQIPGVKRLSRKIVRFSKRSLARFFDKSAVWP